MEKSRLYNEKHIYEQLFLELHFIFSLYISKIKLDTFIYVASILLSPCYFYGENTNFLILFIYFILSHLYVFQ